MFSSLQLRDGQLQDLVWQMVQSLGHGQPHGGAQDASGLSWQSLGGLTQELHAGVGEQGVLAAGTLQGVRDQKLEAFALDHGFEVNTDLDAAGERRVRGAVQGLGQCRMAHQPHADEVA